MKDWELSNEFLRIFTADVINFPAAAINLRTAQSSGDLVLPLIYFEVTARPIDGAGRYLAYALMITIESDPRSNSATPDADHAARVSAVQRKFFGAAAADLATAKTAMQAAMAAGGLFTLKNYDSPPQSASDPSVEAHRFRTVLPIAGIAVVTGNV